MHEVTKLCLNVDDMGCAARRYENRQDIKPRKTLSQRGEPADYFEEWAHTYLPMFSSLKEFTLVIDHVLLKGVGILEGYEWESNLMAMPWDEYGLHSNPWEAVVAWGQAVQSSNTVDPPDIGEWKWWAKPMTESLEYFTLFEGVIYKQRPDVKVHIALDKNWTVSPCSSEFIVIERPLWY